MILFRNLIMCLLAMPLLANAQVTDNFSDGNFSNNPAWQGNVSDFIVNAELQLQLNAAAAGISTLYVPTPFADSAVWEFYFKMDFPPSASNSLIIVLQSDQPDLMTGDGYYLFIGETGGEDAILFYRMDGGAETLLATATLGAVANEPIVRVRMERESGGVWTLFADYAGGQNFVQEFTLEDSTHGSGDLYFGFQCEYTASRVDKFFFDDVLVEPLSPDTDPPGLLFAEAISVTELDVFFDEPLEELTATEPSNYNIDNGIGVPAAAFLDAADKTLVHLSLQYPLSNLQGYVLSVNGMSDLAGNIAPAQNTTFTFVETEIASEFDILINEIMADPTPPVALPTIEFIELYNRSSKVLNLEGFTFSSGGTPQVFPEYLLWPKNHVLVSDDGDADSLAMFGEVVGLPSFPGLVNSGDELTLADPAGNTIHHLNYSLSAYNDPQKESGGWTLELVNPSTPCKGESNWSGSVSLLGGTPGQLNSVLDEKPDEDGPNLLRAFADVAQPYSIDLFFDEGLDKLAAENSAPYSISGNIEITSASILPPTNDVVRLQLGSPLTPSILYEIIVSDQVVDCTGNSINAGSTTLALPEPIEPLDIIINEILFNPETGGVDFLEVFNRSEKVLNVGDLIIGNIQESIDTIVRQVETKRLLFPNSYVVFTKLPSDIIARYSVENEAALIPNDLPSFNNDAGNVTLFRAGPTGAVIIDVFDYSEDYHHPLLDETDGVSLERLSQNDPTQNRNNWQSAAASIGYATPTFKNSQSVPDPTSTESIFQIPEKKLSPDGDGFQDFLIVNYQTGSPGFAAQAKVLDAEGRLVKTLFNNDLLATEGFFRWDGDTDRGGVARIGIYILWVQLFHPDGSVKVFKETCVVAGRL